MRDAKIFHFHSYTLDRQARTISLRYALDDAVQFEEVLSLPETMEFRITDEDALDRALFALHLIGGISYYKTTLAPEIAIHSGTLHSGQADFWNHVYLHGLGEFYYRNGIDIQRRAHFPSGDTPPPAIATADGRPMHALTAIGGGKDSLVSIEMLKQGCIPQTLLRVGPHPIVDRLVRQTGQGSLDIRRTIAPALLELNAQGALNGHVPITAYLSILSVVLAELYGFSAAIFSNERSADAGNTTLQGMEINHQWSKGYAFECMLRDYLATYVTRHVEYFSLLRPFSELHVTRMFTRFPQYLPIATSCNRNWTIASKSTSVSEQKPWCASCPKCAFVFALYAAYLPEEDVIALFKGNLFADESLLPIYRQLLGIEGFKPFECVGTPEETLCAMVLAHERGLLRDTPVMRMAMEESPLPDDMHELIAKEYTLSDRHCIPPQFHSLLPV